jgi:lysophospholipase L1-like esterase
MRHALLCFAAVVALALVAGELGLRAAGVEFRFPTPCVLVDGRGCILPPDRTETMAVYGERFSFTTNSHGLRGRDLGPADENRRRVIVLGDSVAFGVNVDDHEVFSAILDRRLASDGIAVVNAASQYLKGTEQQLRFFVDEADTLRPDLVIVFFSSKNDFGDNARREFYRNGRFVEWRPTPFQRAVKLSEYLPGYRILTDHSWLFGWFCFNWWNVIYRASRADGAFATDATRACLERLRGECQRRHAALAVVIMPDPNRPPGSPNNSPTAAQERTAASIAAELGLAAVDGRQALSKAGTAAMHGDGHLTAAGHRAIAEDLAPRILAWLAAR